MLQFLKVILSITRSFPVHIYSHYFYKALGDPENNLKLIIFYLLKSPPLTCMASSLLGKYFTKKI